MSSRLKLIVSSVIFSIVAYGKDIPITQEVEITIPIGTFSVIEFPFKITAKNVTSFLAEKTIASEEESVQHETLLEEPIDKGKKDQPTKKDQNISIIQNTNSFTFFPKREGVLKIVVWGYDHPILLTLKASKKDGFSSYRFVLPQSKSDDLLLTEQNSHEKVINILMVDLFNQTLPKGYKSSTADKVYNFNGYEIRLNRELIGKRYLAQEWILKNISQENSIIHEESFYQKGVYAVALEADKISKNESIRVFVVRQASEEGKANE